AGDQPEPGVGQGPPAAGVAGVEFVIHTPLSPQAGRGGKTAAATREPAYPIRMLRELSVQNLALIEDVRVELQPGFCAWTGETGAGKSLLLGGLNLLLGERGSAESVRAGAEELRVTGLFDVTRPELRAALE